MDNLIKTILSTVPVSKMEVSNLLWLSFVTILLIWYVKYHWGRRKLYKIASQLKGPRPLPLIGNGLEFMGDNKLILNNAMKIMSSYESPVPVWLGQKLLFGVYKPEQLEIVMNSQHALQKDELYKYSEPLVGLGLFSAPVKKWKKNRKIIMPTFNQKILDSFVEIFSEQAEILTQQFERKVGKGYFDVFHLMSRFQLDAICETAMGVQVNAQTTDSDFINWVNKTFEIMFARMFLIWYHFDFIFNLTKLAGEMEYNSGKVREFTEKVIKQKKIEHRQQMQENEALLGDEYQKRNTFLTQLIEVSEAGANLSNDDLRDEVNTVMVGGSETTASVNSFTLILLGMHPEIQEKVYEEAIEVLGKDRPVECTDLPHLPYTEMVIKESMRLFPVGPMLVRSITQDINLGDKVIPADSSVVFCIIQLHRDPNLYPNPLKFDPQRFSPQECSKRHPYSFLPFSGGPRNCVGVKYAYMAMKTAIATIVRKFKVSTSYKSVEDVELKADLVLKPVKGYKIALELRE